MKQLTDDEKKTIHQSLNRRVPDNKVVVDIGKDSIQMQSFRRLGPGLWLNDKVMNLVLKHLAPALLADVCAAVTEKSPCISWVHTFYRLICN
jgi:Ulp1 family protease